MRFLLPIVLCIGGLFLSSRMQQWDDTLAITKCIPGLPVLQGSPTDSSLCSYRGDVRIEFTSGDYLLTVQGQRVHVPHKQFVSVVTEAGKTAFTWVTYAIFSLTMLAIILAGWWATMPFLRRPMALADAEGPQ